MKYTNIQMERMLADLKPLLGRSGLAGYAAARNARALQAEIADYIDIKNAAIVELGAPVLDENGNETGQVELSFGTPAFEEYRKRMDGIDSAESEPRLYKAPASKLMEQMTGQEMLDLEWMVDFDEDA